MTTVINVACGGDVSTAVRLMSTELALKAPAERSELGAQYRPNVALTGEGESSPT